MQHLKSYVPKGLLRKQQKRPHKQQRQMAIGSPLPDLSKIPKIAPVYLTDIDQIKLPVFIDCLVYETLEKLVVSGDPDPAELLSVWHKLHSDYIERVGGVSLRAVLNREKEIRQIISRYDRIAMLVYIARHMTYTDDIAAALQMEGFKFDSEADEATRERQLRLIEARQKTELMRLNKLVEAKGIAEKGQRKYSWREFNDLLAVMSNGEGFLLRAAELTVGEFCSYLARHRERIEKASKPTFQK